MNIRHSNIQGSREARPSRARSSRGAATRAGGFTLIELMVVLAIMAVVLSLTVGTFRSLSDNNQRTGCAANLSQVYQGLRLYMADEGGQAPLFDPSKKGAADPSPERERNIGLWNLWTFPEPGKEYKIAAVGTAPTARYLRSNHVLHCPSDSEPGAEVRKSVDLYTDTNKTAYNPDFLSYQMFATDGIDKVYSSSDKASDIVLTDTKSQTYLPTRVTSTTDPQFKRQLRQPNPKTANPAVDAPFKRPALDNTVVTWCRHHRYMRDADNVLFFDGSVQLIPREQDEPDYTKKDDACATTGNKLTGSDRLPKRTGCD